MMPSRRAAGDHFGRWVHAVHPTFHAFSRCGPRCIPVALEQGNLDEMSFLIIPLL